MNTKTLALIAVLLGPLGGVALADAPTLAPATATSSQGGVGVEVSPVQVGQLTAPSDADRHGAVATIPLLPYGSFFVSLKNDTSAPITVQPAQLSLVVSGKAMKPLTERAKLDARWKGDAFDDSEYALRGRLVVGDQASGLHRALQVLTSKVVVAPHGTWSGFVIFDVGRRSAEAWTKLLTKAHEVRIELALPGSRVATSFVAVSQP